MTGEKFLHDQYNGRHVAIIGGSGQVGSFLAPLLRDAGARLYIFDKESSVAARDNQDSIHDIIRNPDWARRQIEKFAPDYVFNLAAKVSGVTYNERAHFDMGLYNTLLQAIPLWMCEQVNTRFVQFSTVCVLPHDAPVPTNEMAIEHIYGHCEKSNLGYGLAKQWGEYLCKFAMRETNLHPLVVRPSNLYGRERPDDPMGHVIPRFVWRCMQREDPMAIRGLPSTERSFLHAADCATAAALLAATSFQGTVNIPASANSVRMDELLSLVGQAVGWMPEKVTWGDASQQGYAKRESSRELFDRILSLYGIQWKESWTLERGLADYVQWCRDNFKVGVAA